MAYVSYFVMSCLVMPNNKSHHMFLICINISSSVTHIPYESDIPYTLLSMLYYALHIHDDVRVAHRTSYTAM